MKQKRVYFQHIKNQTTEAVPIFNIRVYMRDRNWNRISRKEYRQQSKHLQGTS